MFLTFFSDFFRIVFRRIMNSMGKLADYLSLRRFSGTEDRYLDHDAIVDQQVEAAKKRKEERLAKLSRMQR